MDYKKQDDGQIILQMSDDEIQTLSFIFSTAHQMDDIIRETSDEKVDELTVLIENAKQQTVSPKALHLSSRDDFLGIFSVVACAKHNPDKNHYDQMTHIIDVYNQIMIIMEQMIEEPRHGY